jgi:hypothetical protein
VLFGESSLYLFLLFFRATSLDLKNKHIIITRRLARIINMMQRSKRRGEEKEVEKSPDSIRQGEQKCDS